MNTSARVRIAEKVTPAVHEAVAVAENVGVDVPVGVGGQIGAAQG